MTRPIKFRAWDNLEKRIFPVERLQLNPDEIDGVFSIKIYDSTKSRGDEMIRDLPLDRIKCENKISYKLMQFTGLLDKNGKEIYEGDIVRRDFSGEDKGFVNLEVKFKDDFFCTDHPRGGVHWGLAYSTPIEIIGNIYKNPDLLDGKIK